MTRAATIFDAVTLLGGPFQGARFRVRRGATLSLTTRRKQGPGDRLPCALYRGDATTGFLTYAGTVGGDPGSAQHIRQRGAARS